MAKSKSTTTPTDASSSRTKDKDDTAARRSSRSNAVTRSNPASPSKRKADDLAGGSRSSKRRAVENHTVSSSASQGATSVRPASSKGKGKGKEIALPELELFKQRHTSLFPGGVVVKVEEPEPDADNIFVRAASPLIDPDDKERLLDFVLIDEFGSEARRLAVEQLFQAARQSAVSETDFCLTYVETTVGRLRQKGIKEQRLAEVVAMLQAGVMEQLRARLDSLGGPLPSPLSLPPPPEIRQVTAATVTNATPNGVNALLKSRSSQQVPVIVSHKGKQRPVRSESVHTPSESSDSGSDEDETVIPGSHRSSRYRDDDDEEYDESSSRVARSQDFVKLEDASINGSTSNFRIYGTRQCNGKPFDHFARAVISACMLAPGDDPTAMRIRGVAYRFWRTVSIREKQKERWKDLSKTRHSDPKVHEKGLKLLKKQGHLAKLKANCKQILNNADAGPSRSGPTQFELAKTPTASSKDTANAQSSSDKSSSSPEPDLPQQTSVAQPRSRNLTVTQSTSRRSPSLVARPGPKHIAKAPSISDRSYSPPEFVLPERTIVALPRFDDTASVQNTPNRSSSPVEPTVSDHGPVIHPTRMKNFKSQKQINLPALFPFLSRARSKPTSTQAYYVPFSPRREGLPSCLFIINTPDVRTKRRMKMTDLELARSTSGISELRRLHKNALIGSFPTEKETWNAQKSKKSMRITLPSSVSFTGDPVYVEASFHAKYPSRVFSCKQDLPIDHATVGSRILAALSGPVAGGPRVSFEVLQKGTEDPPARETRYLIRFLFGSQLPCSGWFQSIYIPMEHEINDKNPKRAWAVFTPEDVYVRCSLCGKQCQRGFTNICPFTKVIASQQDV